MDMGKDTRLVNIYLKIHNKRPLMMDDLAYLAEYSPECFEKTCKNVVYNIPETKPIMEPVASEVLAVLEPPKDEPNPEPTEQQRIEMILESLRCMEINASHIANVDTDKVKSLLGSLYMELLFPHNDRDTFMNMEGNGGASTFDKKV
ncbi:MAG: hypothetical protein K2H41_04655 [Acetatifactor sp.]|nr:hypothetical protein [Acetatifactor sp.]